MYLYVCVYVCMYVCIYMCVCMYVCRCVCVCVTRQAVFMCMCVCVCHQTGCIYETKLTLFPAKFVPFIKIRFYFILAIKYKFLNVDLIFFSFHIERFN